MNARSTLSVFENHRCYHVGHGFGALNNLKVLFHLFTDMYRAKTSVLAKKSYKSMSIYELYTMND